MAELGRVSKSEHTFRAEVHIERDWRQRHEREASRNKEAVHRLFARQQLSGCSGRGSTRESRETSPLWRSRDNGRSPMLSISPSRIREIHDPCSRILNQLHKILFISQLPPSMEGELSGERQVQPPLSPVECELGWAGEWGVFRYAHLPRVRLAASQTYRGSDLPLPPAAPVIHKHKVWPHAPPRTLRPQSYTITSVASRSPSAHLASPGHRKIQTRALLTPQPLPRMELEGRAAQAC